MQRRILRKTAKKLNCYLNKVYKRKKALHKQIHFDNFLHK